MEKELEIKGFQELTEEEATAVDAGAGIASTWVELAYNITSQALSATKNFLDSISASRGSAGVGLAFSLVQQVFSSLLQGLTSRGL